MLAGGAAAGAPRWQPRGHAVAEPTTKTSLVESSPCHAAGGGVKPGFQPPPQQPPAAHVSILPLSPRGRPKRGTPHPLSLSTLTSRFTHRTTSPIFSHLWFSIPRAGSRWDAVAPAATLVPFHSRTSRRFLPLPLEQEQRETEAGSCQTCPRAA